MEAVYSLKRPHQPDFEECIICQESRPERFINGGEKGLETLKQASKERTKWDDTKNRPVIDRILSVTSAEIGLVVWHKSCYSLFTSKMLIQRLQKKKERSTNEDCEPSISNISLRSSTPAVKWDLCIFCQDTKKNEKICSVTTFKMSEQILELSQYNQETHSRLAGINDLIAAEGKYHPNCLKCFQQNFLEPQFAMLCKRFAGGA